MTREAPAAVLGKGRAYLVCFGDLVVDEEAARPGDDPDGRAPTTSRSPEDEADPSPPSRTPVTDDGAAVTIGTMDGTGSSAAI
ncbi:MAG: hypothetical protein JW751_21440 [Polyangiaceae bacterium]|nr:hypothetical protein [Polyangiaceae bacterium]